MNKLLKLTMCAALVSLLGACGAKEEPAAEWNRSGYFQDEGGNFLSLTYMDDVEEPGWYVGVMLGEDPIEDSWGGIVPQEGSSLHGTLASSGSREDIVVTVTEEGEDGMTLAVEGGETYHLSELAVPEATIFTTINVEGEGMIGYEKGETVPELDSEWPFQSAIINLAEAQTYTLAAAPEAGSLFVKWTKNGEDYSTEPVITVELDESADYVAVFEEDPAWQNPVMNFVGDYQCDRAGAVVECLGKEEALITIRWGSSAWETAQWTIIGRLDTETRTIKYEGCAKTILTYDKEGEVTAQEDVYNDGTGTVTFNDDGSFTWHDDKSETGEDMIFEWIGLGEE